MDNGTTVEVFQSLNYYQLAKSSLVSKRFRDLIRNNRHRLALLYVSIIRMDTCFNELLFPNIFEKDLAPEEYNEWIIRNKYSKQIPLESQMAGLQTTQLEGRIYQLIAIAGRVWNPVFFARAKLNYEKWPLFQHFIRLLTDPFIYLHEVTFNWTAQKDCFNLLTGIINPDLKHLQCHTMKLYSEETALDFPDLIAWVKCHLLCDELAIQVNRSSDYDELLLDFIMTGGHCTSAINIVNYGLTSILYDFAEKFMDLKKGDECQVVQSIKGDIQSHLDEPFKDQLGKFIVKEKLDVDEINGERKEIVFEFVNKDINQKCQFTATYT